MSGATPVPPGIGVLAAVSGGPDSSALLVWLMESGADVTAAHFDHALRPDSDRDAEHVANRCASLGVPLICERRARQLPRGSLQAAARALRYDFLGRVQRETGRELVCLGHTADDVVESAVMHLLRGSGLAGMRGMPQRRGPFFRPLLRVWRAEIEAYLAARRIEPLRDPSNVDTARFARARVRCHLLPRLEHDRPGLTKRIRAAAEAAAGMQERLEAEAGRMICDLGASREELRAASRTIRLEVYRQLYGSQPALSRCHLAAIDELALRGSTGSGLDLPGGMRFRVEPDRVSIGVATMPVPPLPRLVMHRCRGCGDTDAAHLRLGLELSVGYRCPGLRMRPLGSPGTRKLQDVLTDAKVPRHLRDRLPLVFAGGRLAWVPGVAIDAEAAAPLGADAMHVSLGEPGVPFKGSSEIRVVLSNSPHPRSPVI